MLKTVMTISDASLLEYSRTFDTFALEFVLWNEKVQKVMAHDVTSLEDDGTWEAEAIVYLNREDNDNEERWFGVTDTEDRVTLRFKAKRVEIIPISG